MEKEQQVRLREFLNLFSPTTCEHAGHVFLIFRKGPYAARMATHDVRNNRYHESGSVHVGMHTAAR